MRLTPRRRQQLEIFALALAAHLIPMAIALVDPRRAYTAGDSESWFIHARNLVLYHVYSGEAAAPFLPGVFRTPAYPVFLAGVFGLTNFNLGAVLAVQAVLAALSAVFLFELATRIGLSDAAARLGAIAINVYPLAAIFWATLASENLFVFFLVLTLLLTWDGANRSWLNALATGGAAGLMTLTRPIGVLVLPALAIGVIWKCAPKQAALRLVSASLGLGLVLTPWLWRNARVFGKPALASVGGINLLTYNAAAVLTHRAGLGFWEGRYLVYDYWNHYYESLDPKPQNEVEDAYAMQSAAMVILMENPALSIWINSVESLNSLRPGFGQFTLFLQPNAFHQSQSTGNDVSPASGSFSRPLVLGVTIALTAFYGAAYLAFALGAILMLLRREWPAVFALLAPTAILLLSPGPVASSRFRVPAEPLMALVAAYAIREIVSRWRDWRAAPRSGRHPLPA
ncbi:MAG: glycosyltransferase family 39 protein [Chloroflexi bacterium]|nr:glycosyltransferase family 39 protein [Chloroflexota bacterium]